MHYKTSCYRSLEFTWSVGDFGSEIGAEVDVLVIWEGPACNWDIEDVELRWDAFVLKWTDSSGKHELDLTEITSDDEKARLLGWADADAMGGDLGEDILYSALYG